MDTRKSQTRAAYNENATTFAKKFDELGPRVGDIKFALSFVPKNPFVYELGCGNGRDAQELLRWTNKYSGIDISREFVRLAKQKAPKGTFKVGDFSIATFPQGIDAIFAFASLLHVDRDTVKAIFERAYKAMKPGGVFFISVKFGNYVEEKKQDEFGTRYFYFYTPKLLKALAGKKFRSVWERAHSLRGQKWVDIIFQK